MGRSTVTLVLGFMLSVHSVFSVCDDTWSSSNMSEDREKDANKCLASIQFDESAYQECRDNSTMCYIFIGQEPYIEIPDEFEQLGDYESTSKTNQTILRELQRPFKCDRPKTLKMNRSHSPGGVMFEVFNTIETQNPGEVGNYMCMWGGPVAHCKFNALVDFIYRMDERGYHFAIANYLVELPERVCKVNRGSPLGSDTISVVARTDSNSALETSLQFAARRFASPFKWSAWYMLIFLITLIFTCAALVVRFISPENEKKWSFKRTVMVLYGDSSVILGASANDITSDQESNNDNNAAIVFDDDEDISRNNIKRGKKNNSSRRSRHFKKQKFSKAIIVSSLHASLVSLVGIYILFYEIGVFEDHANAKNRLNVDLKKLPDTDWKNYCLNGNSAVESVMIHYGKFSTH